MWNVKNIPDRTYDVNVATNYNNRELVSWYSNIKKFKKIILLAHQFHHLKVIKICYQKK